MTREQAEQLRKLLENQTASMTDEQILKYPDFVEKWQSGKEYVVGKRLEYNGTIRYLPHTQAKIHGRHRMHRLCSPMCLYRTVIRFQSGNSRTVRIHMPRATRLRTTARHGRAPRITTSGSRVCMDGKRCKGTRQSER